MRRFESLLRGSPKRHSLPEPVAADRGQRNHTATPIATNPSRPNGRRFLPIRWASETGYR